MKIVATKLLNYDKNFGVVAKNNEVMQFVYTSSTPFGKLLEPLKEVTEIKKDFSTMFDVVYSDDFGDELAENNKAIGDTYTSVRGDVSIGVKHSGNILNEESLDNLELNNSVFSVGVSLEESQTYKEKLMSLGVPIFVYIDVREMDEMGIISLLKQEYLAITGFYYALDTTLSFYDSSKLIFLLAENGFKKVRLLGSDILKLRGSNNSGLFSPSIVSRYNLEYDYINNTHPVTQVTISLISTEPRPMSELNYIIKEKSSKKVSSRISENGEVTSEKKISVAKKPTKKKLSRFDLFGGI